MPFRVATEGRAIVWSAPAFTSGGWFNVYSTRSKGAPAGPPSYESATRRPVPVPVMMITKELPPDHPGRSTISWITEDSSGVRWFGPASPMACHGGGDQGTDAVVLVLDEIFQREWVNVEA